MSKEFDLPGCKITIRARTSSSITLHMQFTLTTYTTVESPTFSINGAINFKFKALKINDTREFLFFVSFAKKRKDDELDYTISYTHWIRTERMKLSTADGKYQFICSDGSCTGSGDISVEVNLTPLANPCAILYDDTALTDFKLLGDDGYILLHKAITAAHSPFFKTMFEGKWKETAEGVVEVPGVPQSTLEHLKEYMYLGTVPKTCEKLILLANCYMMEDLEHRCLFMLRSKLTKVNCLDMIEFAVLHKQRQLLYEIIDSLLQGEVAVDNPEEILGKHNISSTPRS